MAHRSTDLAFWISQHESYIKTSTMTLRRRGHCTMLSVIFDSDLRKRFSSVRITMVALDIDWEKHRRLLEETSIAPSLGDRRVSTTIQPDKSLRIISDPDGSKLFHLVLTLSPEQPNSGIGSVAIVKPLPLVAPEISAELSPAGRILLDSMLPVPQHGTGSHVWIESTIDIAFRDIFHPPGHICTLSFHISPIQRGLYRPSHHTGQNLRTAPINKLPISLIFLIAQLTTRPYPSQLLWGGRSRSPTLNQFLLNCALVQKSWKPLLELLYSSIDARNPITEPGLLACGLTAQPSIRSCVTSFEVNPRLPSVSDWSNWMTFHFSLNKEYLEVLRLTAASLTTIGMSYDLLYPLRDQLAQLPRIKVCRLTGWGNCGTDAMISPMHFSSMLRVIRHWSHLEYLRIALPYRRLKLITKPGPNSSAANPPSITPSDEPPATTTSSLVELRISTVEFTSQQITHLILSSRNTLRRLSLTRTEALSEIDIYNIVALIHRTIEDLRIEQYHIKSPSFDDRGHTPIDSLIPEMQNIQQLRIHKSLVTPAAISLKPHCSTAFQKTQDSLSTPTIDRCCRIIILWFGETIAKCWSADSVLEAIKTTGWGEISIGGQFERPDRRRLSLLAKKRGVYLNLYAYG